MSGIGALAAASLLWGHALGGYADASVLRAAGVSKSGYQQLSSTAMMAPSASVRGADYTVSFGGVEPQPDRADDERRLPWRYPHFRAWQYVASTTVTATSIVVEVTNPNLRIIEWRSMNALDAAVERWMSPASEKDVARADEVSDWLWYGTQGFVIVDSLATPLIADSMNYETAFQLTLINWQVLGLTGLASRSFHKTIGRDRPQEDGSSFISGHTALATASAALICSHHANLPLYGHPAADAVPCFVGASSAAAAGVLRLRARKHWATDVLAGWGVGALLGGGLPWLLHYRHDDADLSEEERGDGAALRYGFVPKVDETTLGLEMKGLF